MKMILAKSLQKMGYTLRFYRKLRGLSQMDLAHNAGLSFRNYQRLENGEVLPRIDTLMCLCKELGLPLSDLVECVGTEKLGVRESFTEQEQQIFQILSSQSQKPSFSSLNQALESSSIPLDFQRSLYPVEIHSNKATVCERFQTQFQLSAGRFNLDELTAGAMSVDIWEFVASRNLKQVIVSNLLQLPTGLKLIEGYWQILSSSPEDPRSIGFFRDCTNSCELEEVLKASSKILPVQATGTQK